MQGTRFGYFTCTLAKWVFYFLQLIIVTGGIWKSYKTKCVSSKANGNLKWGETVTDPSNGQNSSDTKRTVWDGSAFSLLGPPPPVAYCRLPRWSAVWFRNDENTPRSDWKCLKSVEVTYDWGESSGGGTTCWIIKNRVRSMPCNDHLKGLWVPIKSWLGVWFNCLNLG